MLLVMQVALAALLVGMMILLVIAAVSNDG